MKHGLGEGAEIVNSQSLLVPWSRNELERMATLVSVSVRRPTRAKLTLSQFLNQIIHRERLWLRRK